MDYVILFRIVVLDKELVDVLYLKIVEDGGKFEDLVKEYLVINDKNFNGFMGVVNLVSLLEDLRNIVNFVNFGDVLGLF